MSRASKFYQFKSKQPIDNNMNEPLSKLKYHGLYPNRTTVIVEDWIINGEIEKNKKDRSVTVRNFPGATVADVEHYPTIIQKKPSDIILIVGTNDAKNSPSQTVLGNLLMLKALMKDSLPPTCRIFI